MLIYPWGYKNEETIQAPIFKEYATWMTRINKYGIGTTWETLGYLTNGEADDWLYGDVARKKSNSFDDTGSRRFCRKFLASAEPHQASRSRKFSEPTLHSHGWRVAMCYEANQINRICWKWKW